MKRIIRILGLIGALLFVLSVPAFAVGTCVKTVTTSTTTNARIPDSVTVMVSLACTADSGGTTSYAVALTPATGTVLPYNLFGYYLYQVGRTPGSSAPSASYSVTITDVQGFALDLGLLTSNGSASVPYLNGIYSTTTVYPVIRSIPTVATSGLGSGGKVTIDLIFKAY
jgi:hypothetical protein